MRSYDATSEIYDDRYEEEQNRKYCTALQKVDIEGKVVLDAGCGSGLFLNKVALKVQLVVGVDISGKILRKAKRKVRPFENVLLLQADIDHLPFKDDFFERIFTFTVLQNVTKPKKAIKELQRVARTKQKIVLTGLKKVFSFEKFMDILGGSSMNLTTFIDDEAVNCYVAVLCT